jgi:uncharacterized protein (TIGR00255 family)
MVVSMTGFAAGRGEGAGASWAWDLRGVNGKGLDIRLRLPEGVDGLEQMLRAEIGKRIRRGNLSLSLRLARAPGVAALNIDPAMLAAALAALGEVERAAAAAGLTLAPTSAADVLAQRGVLAAPEAEAESGPLLAALKDDLGTLLERFQAARLAEGRAIGEVLAGQVDRLEALAQAAREAAGARREQAAESLKEALDRLVDNAEGLDEARVAQELALLAVKTDVTEELDRLDAHVVAARGLLAEAEPVGRKLDFLMQEFNREANTLCSKAQSAELTRLGLDLKVVIDQMREQVQNVE